MSAQGNPVTDWENQEFNGHALCGEAVLDEYLEGVKSLRDRQKAYLDSLPSDPPEVIREALTLLHQGGSEYPDGIEEALHMSHALWVLLKDNDMAGSERSREVALYFADSVSFAMLRATSQLDRISAILHNSLRIEREKVERV